MAEDLIGASIGVAMKDAEKALRAAREAATTDEKIDNLIGAVEALVRHVHHVESERRRAARMRRLQK